MNEKFFDLKKEKQNRMINAVMQIFAKNGYKQASTDEIVSVAGISKGLLFHYFGSKIGSYAFAYEYAVKYIQIETESTIDSSMTDFFELIDARCTMMKQISENYPYLTLFLDRTKTEDMIEALKVSSDHRMLLDQLNEDFIKQAAASSITGGADPEKLLTIVDSVSHCYLERTLHEGSFTSEAYGAYMKEYVDMLRVFHKKK